MSSLLRSIRGKIAVMLVLIGVLTSAMYSFYTYRNLKNEALNRARTQAMNLISRSVQMFMVSTIKYHDEFAAAPTDEERKASTEKWTNSIVAVDKAVIHDHGEGQARVRLIGDLGIYGYKPFGGKDVAIQNEFEKRSSKAISGGEAIVEEINNEFLRIAVPLPSDAHPGCAECHGVSVSEHAVLGSLNAYIPLTEPLAEARSEAWISVLVLLCILAIFIGSILYIINRFVAKLFKNSIVSPNHSPKGT